MANVAVTRTARADLDELAASNSLPSDYRDQVRDSLRTLEVFPESGTPLEGRWAGLRSHICSWNWLIAVYLTAREAESSQVTVIAFHDSRASVSPKG